MIATTVFKHGGISGTITYSDLKKKIEDDFGIKKIPDLHLREAIASLDGEDVLSEINSKLTLSQVKRNEIKKTSKKCVNLRTEYKMMSSNPCTKKSLPFQTNNTWRS